MQMFKRHRIPRILIITMLIASVLSSCYKFGKPAEDIQTTEYLLALDAKDWLQRNVAYPNDSSFRNLLQEMAKIDTPEVKGVINGGGSQITGEFTIEEAQDLAATLRCGTLPAKIQVLKETVIGGHQ
jgi:SecD/SecF fusion protein